MDKNSSQPSEVSYTGGVRNQGSDNSIKRFDNPKDAYNDLYQDIHAKLNGNSSWVKPNTPLSTYISNFAPKKDHNDPKSYTNHMINYFNSKLKNYKVTSNSSLGDIKNALIKEKLDPEHEFTKAHLGIEDSTVLKALKLT